MPAVVDDLEVVEDVVDMEVAVEDACLLPAGVVRKCPVGVNPHPHFS